MRLTIGLLVVAFAGIPAAGADPVTVFDASADAAIPMGNEARKDDKKVVLNVFGMT